nr:hypothetical protein [Tanacetum cinerariifolium]
MVAFLKKPRGNEAFHQIVDFLNVSHIMYVLTENPTIYVSYINQFWHTASTRTLDNGEIELNATADGHNRTITEASVWRHLKLTDAEDTRLNTSHKRLYIAPVLTQKVFSNIKRESRGFYRLETSLFPTMLVTKQISEGEGPTSPVGTRTTTVIVNSPQLQNISTTYRKTRTRTRRMGIRIPQSNVPTNVADEAITKEMHGGLGRATTTASSLEAETSTEGGLGCHFTMGDSPVQARSEKSEEVRDTTQAKRGRAVIDSLDEEEPHLDIKDSPKQGRMIEEIDKDENVNLRSTTKDKGKGIMQETKLPKKSKKREMIHLGLDEELTQKLHAKELEKVTGRQEKEMYNLEKALELHK